jgi:TPR repeat protein
MENDRTTAAVPTKEELQAFIQARSYYYIPKWESFDPTLKRVAPGTFNWAACVLNVFWMAYRRMYLFVIILVAFEAVCYSIVEFVFGLPTSITNGVGIAMMIILGRYGNSIYRKHVERKIRRIKTNMAPEYWSQGFRDSGGTSLWAPIPLIILHLLTIYGTYQGILQKNVNANVVASTSSVTQATDSEFDQDKKLAENGDAIAQYNLGVNYATGQGVATNLVEAIKWYHKAADQGNATAQRLLGVYYYNGWGGLTVDYAEAAKWYRKAADQNEITAEWCLGDCYAKGQGVPLDYEEAVKWYRKAADQGDATAQSQLGYFYLSVSKNYEEAVKWYRRAASQNSAYAQDVLAGCCKDGQGTATNLVEAYKWYNLASAQGYVGGGYTSATTERDALAALMTPEQIAEGQRLSSEFKPHTESASEAAAMAAQDAAQHAQFEDNKAKAEKGDANAQYYLGYCYFNGQGVTKDLDEAVKWFRKAADQGNAGGQFYLGYYYFNGWGVETNLVEAYKWFNLASAQGITNATTSRNTLEGWMTHDQIAGGQRLSREFQPHTESVATNFDSTENPTTNAVVQPDAKQTEADRAEFEDNKVKAGKGDATAQRRLGNCYYNGKGVAVDYAEAAKWFRKAADQGNAKAQSNLGLCYATGKGAPQDYTEAVKWFRKAADQGNANGQYLLAIGYYNGLGVPQDYEEAVKWYLKAADQGHALAQSFLGGCYAKGQGVATNYVEADKWFRRAADQGNAIAQSILAASYADGKGVETNAVEAYKWDNLASAQGNGFAKKDLSILEKKMTPEQIADGQRLVREFQPHTESASTNSN